MVMDGHMRGYCKSTSGSKMNHQNSSIVPDQNFANSFKLPDQNFVNGFKLENLSLNQNFLSIPPVHSIPDPSIIESSSESDSHEDYDFSDVVLKYISEMLMEEDMEDKFYMLRESAALRAAEKSFYDVIGERYPPSSDDTPKPYLSDHVKESPAEYAGDYGHNYKGLSTGVTAAPCQDWNYDPSEYEALHIQQGHLDHSSQTTSQSSFSSSSSSTVIDGIVDSPVSTLRVQDIFSDNQSVLQFQKGVEEASKFLPKGSDLFVNVVKNELLKKEQNGLTKGVMVKLETRHEKENFLDSSRRKKNSHSEDLDLEEGRSNKHSAVYTESTVRSEMFDMVLLCSEGKNDSALREALQRVANKNITQSGQSEGSNGGKTRGKKQGGRRNVVDLRTLLTLCAQAVAADDRRTANELLKQIRQHSTPTGDGMQRLAHYFADGLEARMAGSGTHIYTAHISYPISAADVLKAYHLYLATCPFKKISNFFSNKSIMNVSDKATRLHIIDFGILYGFQWPSLIQRLSARPGGPPELKITGVDLPQPGFRPAQRVKETGRRLSNYAETFKVPFEFNAIAQKWETLQLEDFKIEDDEVLVVNCLFRFRNLLDETVVVDSPRNMVLNLIRRMNPDLFIHGIVNGSYSAPFFITRFREALFHFSSLFDMLEANIPRVIHERVLIEKTMFGREAMNVIACEAAERIERPETYKQWQVRNVRNGFRQLPLNMEIVEMAKRRVNTSYHKDFVIDVDGQWLLQGWKGRIVYALSSWKPAH